MFRIFAHINFKKLQMTDQEIYNGFLSGDNKILTKFLQGRFEIVLDKIFDKVFSKDSDFKSAKARAFNDLYNYLTENDCERLRGYESDGNGNFIVWLAMMANKYYLNERNKAKKRQKRRKTESRDDKNLKKIIKDEVWIDNSFENKDFLEFCEKIINTMKNQKHAEIMRSLLIRNDFDASTLTIKLNLSEGSIYATRQRAEKQFLQIYLKLKEK